MQITALWRTCGAASCCWLLLPFSCSVQWFLHRLQASTITQKSCTGQLRTVVSFQRICCLPGITAFCDMWLVLVLTCLSWSPLGSVLFCVHSLSGCFIADDDLLSAMSRCLLTVLLFLCCSANLLLCSFWNTLCWHGVCFLCWHPHCPVIVLFCFVFWHKCCNKER